MNASRAIVVKLLDSLHLKDQGKACRRWVIDHLPSKRARQKVFNGMQRSAYGTYTETYEDAKQLCVGMFEDHQAYPYEAYLLERYSGPRVQALDFGCGMGRMIQRMLREFDVVHGADLMQQNLDYAGRYLSEEHNIADNRYRLFKTDGMGCSMDCEVLYDFIYSTICLQHIPVHEIRRQILQDLHQRLSDTGQCCLQLGFGMDNGIHWFDNEYAALSTNGGCDVCVPDESHFPIIAADLSEMGFSKTEFAIKASPHGAKYESYHSNWLFIHLWK